MSGARARLQLSANMNRYEFYLEVSPEEFLDYYRGTARQVVVRSTDGQNVRFPAGLLQKFVTPEGIRGHFVLTCDDNHKGAELRRLD